MTESNVPPSQPPQDKRPRGRRTLGRIAAALLLLALLLALVVLAVEIVLRTDAPRRIVLDRLQKETGLRITAASLSTTWTGHTLLRDVVISLPLADEPLLVAPRLEVHHTNLVGLVLGIVSLHEVRLDSPILYAREDALGRWNLLEALATIEHASTDDDDDLLDRHLPAMTITNATAFLTLNNGRRAVVGPVEFRGQPHTPVAWHFRASIHPHLALEGRLAPHAPWEHSLSLAVRNVDPSLLGESADWPALHHLDAEWRGRMLNDELSGRLAIQSARLGDLECRGNLALRAAADSLILAPDRFIADFGDAAPGQVELVGGDIEVAGSAARLRALHARLLGGDLRIGGDLDWQTPSATLDAAWTGLQFPRDFNHAGSAYLALRTPWPDTPDIRLDLSSKGDSPHGQWDVRAGVRGQGSSWSDINWHATFPQLAWDTGDFRADLKDLSARIETDAQSIRLVQLTLPQSQPLAATGQYDRNSGDWRVDLDARAFHLPQVPRPADVVLAAQGSRQRIELSRLEISSGEYHIHATGEHVFARAAPLEASVRLKRLAAHDKAKPGPATKPAEGFIRAKALDGSAHATGTLDPLDVRLSGRLMGNDIALGPSRLGDIAAEFEGHLDPAGVRLKSSELKLLEGRWFLNGHYRFEDASATLGVNLWDLPLKQLDGLVQPAPGLDGALQAQVNVHWPRFDRDELNVSGAWSIENFRKDVFAAERIAGRLAIEQDDLVLDGITLRQAEGSATASARLNLRQRSRLTLTADVSQWPLDLPHLALALKLDAGAKIEIDLDATKATGPVVLSADAIYQDKPAGSLTIDALLNGRELQVRSLTGSPLGASIDGQATVLLDDWTRTTGKIAWTDLDAARLLDFWPDAKDLRGAFSGSIALSRAAPAYAAEPLRVELSIRPKNAAIGALDLGEISATLYAGRDADARKDGTNALGRVVMESALLALADGQVEAWARLSRHNQRLYSHAQFTLRSLELDQLVHFVEPAAEPMPGRVAGQVTVFGPLGDIALLNGRATLNLDNADLLNSDIISAMHAATNAPTPEARRTGRGRADIRIEQQKLFVLGAVYRSGGLEVRGSGELSDLALGADSPLSGYVLGSARPFRDLKLPFFADIDRVMDVLQANVTTMRLGGTVREPSVTPAAISDLGQSLRRILQGEVDDDGADGAVR